MKRTVRSSPYQVADLQSVASVPRPIYRKVVFINPFQVSRQGLEVVAPSSGAAAPVSATFVVGRGVRRHVNVGLAKEIGSPTCRLLREREEEEREQLADLWISLSASVATDSDILSNLPSAGKEQLKKLFLDRAPATLRKHVSGWRLWLAFCAAHGWQPGAPSLQEFLDFVTSLHEGSRGDRGSHRAISMQNVVSSLSFAAHKLQLTKLLHCLESPLIQAWRRSGKWSIQLGREAVPLPLNIVQRLEEALSTAPAEEHLLISVILLMVWASLRWSDAQRLRLSSVTFDGQHLKGFCWRTKSSAKGMTFGCCAGGCAGVGWGAIFFAEVEKLRSACPTRDYLLAHNGKPLSYIYSYAFPLETLFGGVWYAGLTPDMACTFTLHSLKCTVLAWALQLQVDAADRASQGHHKQPGVSGCVQKYGRDDVVGQLRCQSSVLDAIEQNWAPKIPLERGIRALQTPVSVRPSGSKYAVVEDSETESESSQGESSSVVTSDGEQSSECDDVDVVASELVEFEGPWIVNTVSGVGHRALSVDEDDSNWCLACRPGSVMHAGYEMRFDNPWFDGFRLCRHRGCC